MCNSNILNFDYKKDNIINMPNETCKKTVFKRKYITLI